MTNRPNITRTAITLGVIGSLAGNVAWAWDRSPVLVGVGIAMSLVLPVAVMLWGASKGATGWPRVERAIVMGAICGGAALYTLVHSSSLLAEKGLPWSIAWIPATVMELLVVQAARASSPQPKPAPARAPKREAKPQKAPEPVSPPPAVNGHRQRKALTPAERQDRYRKRKKAEAVSA